MKFSHLDGHHFCKMSHFTEERLQQKASFESSQLENLFWKGIWLQKFSLILEAQTLKLPSVSGLKFRFSL